VGDASEMHMKEKSKGDQEFNEMTSTQGGPHFDIG